MRCGSGERTRLLRGGRMAVDWQRGTLAQRRLDQRARADAGRVMTPLLRARGHERCTGRNA
jgi:hypothetical protein